MITPSNHDRRPAGVAATRHASSSRVATLSAAPQHLNLFAWLAVLFLFATTLVQAAPRFVPERLLVKPKHDVAEAELHRVFGEHGAVQESALAPLDIRVLRVPAARQARALEGLKHNPHIEFVELDELLAPDRIPNDPYYASSWHLPKVSAPAAWDVNTGSAGVLIAILDTGVDATHPDLAAKLVPGWNIFDNNPDTSDVHGHGTSVAGVAAAIGNNSLGVTGVAWGCKVLPIRVTDLQGYATYSALAAGLSYAADHGARVANISFRASTSGSVTTAAQYFQSKGGVVTVAAGNQGEFEPASDNPYVLTVSATTSTDALASWSNTGSNVDLAAPGSSLYATRKGGGYGTVSGTSFSAPLVAGVAALVISADPALTGAEVQDILKAAADDRGTAGWDAAYGHGRVNADKAVRTAASTSEPAPAPTPTPAPTIDTAAPSVAIIRPANGSTVGQNLSIAIQANDNVAVTRVELHIDGRLYASSTSSAPVFSWKTNRIARGAHTLQAIARDAAGNVGRSAVVTVYK